METINGLLKALDNKVPASMAKRLEGLSKINQKLAVVREEHNANPTEESQEKLDEIIEFITDTQDDLIEDLSELVDKKREAETKNRQIAKNKAEAEAEAEARNLAEINAKKRDAEARNLAERKARQAKAQSELKHKELEQKELEEKEALEKEALEKEALEKEALEKDPKKKSGIGWGGLIVGGALLILSAGAINYFGKKQ